MNSEIYGDIVQKCHQLHSKIYAYSFASRMSQTFSPIMPCIMHGGIDFEPTLSAFII